MAVGSADPPSFGQRLRRLRLGAGLTQQGLADRSGVSVDAVSALENGRRRHPRVDTVAMLAEALGLRDSERDELTRAATRQGQPRIEQVRRAELATPAGRLVGRDRELAQALSLLGQPHRRLLTLTGPPGVGKTRLALALADLAGADHPDGVVWVSLAGLDDHLLVGQTIREALGLRGDGQLATRQLAAYLGRRRTLILLDNFEHVLPAAGLLSELFVSCPGLRVLATSRCPLRLRDEQELPLAPLPLTDAVTLFVQLAQARSPEFRLAGDDRQTVTDICCRLDGLPLAIELAAPWIRTLGPRGLLARLTDRLDLLVDGAQDLPERQRTMRAALRWSYDLLSAEEQRVFRRASVFADGATLEAIDAVCGTDRRDVLHAVAGLIDRGLLVRCDLAGRPRVRMLETVREYGRELLERDGEAEATGRAHACFFAALVETAHALRDRDEARWLASLALDLANLRATLHWALDHGEAAFGLRVATHLRRVFDRLGHLREGQAWLEDWLHAEVAPDLRARALCASAELAWRLGDRSTAVERWRTSLELSPVLDDPHGRHQPGA